VSEERYRGYDGELAVRIYRPAGRPEPAALALLFHGGGFVKGDIDAMASLAERASVRLGLVVATPAYTLATQLPFPAAAEDAYAALVWASRSARRAGWDPERIVVAGEEAGGNLAAVCAMAARDRGGPAIAAQVLVGPMLDPSLTSRSMQRVASGAIHASGVCGACYRTYLPNAADRLHPYAAPASSARLTGLPPALILTCDGDPLRDEAEDYGTKLIAAGVTTQVSRLPRIENATHCWTDDALTAIDAFLRPRLDRHRNLSAP
jgi:acetyl esterase